MKASNASVTESLAGGQLFITVASYKGALVAVKKVHKPKVNIDRALLQEMRNVSIAIVFKILLSRILPFYM